MTNASALCNPPVCVLLAVYNGAAYLRGQLDSIAKQTGVSWTLIASDDGSSDDSLDILHSFAASQEPGRVQVFRGPRQGGVENFRFLLSLAPDDRPLAYSDQDDIWFPDKLSRAVQMLSQAPASTPALYGASVVLADAGGRPRSERATPIPKRPLGFRNALIQNVFQGNTVAVNPAAARLLKQAEQRLRTAGHGYVLHDWWAYLLISGTGGHLIMDPKPCLLYRQHGRNQIGANTGARAMLRRIQAVMAGRNAGWLDSHLRALECVADLLPPESLALLRDVTTWRRAGVATRMKGLWHSGLYLQRRRANLGLWFATMLGKL